MREEANSLKDQVARLEEELAKICFTCDSALSRVGELQSNAAEFEASKPLLRAEVIEAFRNSQEYADEVGSKAASKIHATYLATEKYLKECPDGCFDDFVDFYLAEEEKAQTATEDVGSLVGE